MTTLQTTETEGVYTSISSEPTEPAGVERGFGLSFDTSTEALHSQYPNRRRIIWANQVGASSDDLNAMSNRIGTAMARANARMRRDDLAARARALRATRSNEPQSDESAAEQEAVARALMPSQDRAIAQQ